MTRSLKEQMARRHGERLRQRDERVQAARVHRAEVRQEMRALREEKEAAIMANRRFRAELEKQIVEDQERRRKGQVVMTEQEQRMNAALLKS